MTACQEVGDFPSPFTDFPEFIQDLLKYISFPISFFMEGIEFIRVASQFSLEELPAFGLKATPWGFESGHLVSIF